MAGVTTTQTPLPASAAVRKGQPVQQGGRHALQVSFGAVSKWKNIGYYVAGATYESWESTGAPSTTPTSGHTLINIHSFREQ